MGRGTTSATQLFQLGREGPPLGSRDSTFWRSHLDRERCASANLLANLLDGQGADASLSFLRSSSVGSGGWELCAPRQRASTMVAQRLHSAGELAGPLQLTSSSSSLGYSSHSLMRDTSGGGEAQSIAPPDFSLPADLLPRGSRGSLASASHSPVTTVASLHSLKSFGVTPSERLVARDPTPLMARSSSLSTLGSRRTFGSLPGLSAEPARLLSPDGHYPRPRPLISEQGGFRSSHRLRSLGQTHAGWR